MRPFVLLCTLLCACDPLPLVPVPAQQPERAAEPAAEVPAVAEDAAPPEVVDSNRAPVILAIALDPSSPRTGDDIRARIEAEDPDGDMVRFEYSWFVNDKELRAESQETLAHRNFAKGDMLRLRVRARDREFDTEGSSSPILVRNTPPEIVNKSGNLRGIDGFRVRAEDVDGDELSFRLEGQPEGMSIDASTGVLSYSGSEAARAGNYHVNVVVEDPDGGSARWSFGITVSAGSQAEREAASAAEAAQAEKSSHRSRGWSARSARSAEAEEPAAVVEGEE